jgi:hypothetical protein
MNNDGKNDITGEPYSGNNLYGYRLGKIDEEMGIQDPDFQDSDGDGMNDRFIGYHMGTKNKGIQWDQFIDRDGDGIADDRGLERLRGKGKKKGLQ